MHIFSLSFRPAYRHRRHHRAQEPPKKQIRLTLRSPKKAPAIYITDRRFRAMPLGAERGGLADYPNTTTTTTAAAAAAAKAEPERAESTKACQGASCCRCEGQAKVGSREQSLPLATHSHSSSFSRSTAHTPHL